MIFVFNKLPEDGTFKPKHIGVHTQYGVCFMMFYCIYLVNLLVKTWN